MRVCNPGDDGFGEQPIRRGHIADAGNDGGDGMKERVKLFNKLDIKRIAPRRAVEHLQSP
jgi:hypothetical protein